MAKSDSSRMRSDYAHPYLIHNRDQTQSSHAKQTQPQIPQAGVDVLYHTRFNLGVMDGVVIYVHPSLRGLEMVLRLLESAGARIIHITNDFPLGPPTPTLSPLGLQTHTLSHSPIKETYLLVPMPLEPSSIQSHHLFKSTLLTTSHGTSQVSVTFLDTRLAFPLVRPSHHPLFRPLSTSLPILNFTYAHPLILGRGSALLIAYRYFCEAAKYGPRVYDQNRNFQGTDKSPTGKVDLVVITPGSKGGYFDFGNDKFWHTLPGKRAQTTPFQDLMDLVERQVAPVFVKEGWLRRVVETGEVSEVEVGDVEVFTVEEVREAIYAYRPRPLPRIISAPVVRWTGQLHYASPPPSARQLDRHEVMRTGYDALPLKPSLQPVEMDRAQDEEVTEGEGSGLVWHYVEIILDLNIGMAMKDLLDMLKGKFPNSERIFSFSSADRMIYDSTPLLPAFEDRHDVVLKLGTTVYNGFSTVTRFIMDSYPTLSQLQIIDSEGELMLLKRDEGE